MPLSQIEVDVILTVLILLFVIIVWRRDGNRQKEEKVRRALPLILDRPTLQVPYTDLRIHLSRYVPHLSHRQFERIMKKFEEAGEVERFFLWGESSEIHEPYFRLYAY